ncbi:LysM peptidoglycan-binding domain-containing protein [Halothermothrix orenii]|uniref:Type II and III secretion system protein n=1 Tax=Halothermothrix orenii (strain H 168 / OCM 544 / DSM 9562) TaxID=373903 RepID=B8D2D9_HALOH|nr:LysM peptidoglycan-binding domain-containing protein [Halothermothrix orenii]ACL69366.1 type II and III secretion system protein [Halothermothrix orenii H 168]
MKTHKKLLAGLMLYLIILSIPGFAFASNGIDSHPVKVDMNFEEAEIQDVLTAIASLVNINLVVDSSVSGEITVKLDNMSFKEALDYVVKVSGLDYVWKNDTVIVASSERLKSFYGEELVETVSLKYSDPVHIYQLIKVFYPELKVQVDSNNLKLLMSGKRKTILAARNLIDRIDVPDSLITATYVAKFINADSLENHLRRIYPGLVLSSDRDNNILLIYGSKRKVREALELVNRIDLPRKEATFIVDINKGDVTRIEETVLNLFPDLVVEGNEASHKLIISGDKEEALKARDLIKEIDIGEEIDTEVVRVDYGNLDNLISVIQGLFPDIRLQSNPLKKEIIIKGNTSEVQEIVSLVNSLDIPRRQVIIEARFEEISANKISEFGMRPNLSEIQFIFDEATRELKSMNITWPEYLRFLEEEGQANMLANPRLLTLNGENARLLIGDKVPVKIEETSGSSEESEGESNAVSYEYIDVGISLEFTPWITEDGYIIMDVAPEVSSLGSPMGGGESIPPIKTREARTKIRLKDGQTFAIGGLIREDELESIAKVPLLGDIPLLGTLFRRSQTDKVKTEVVIFITPHIVKESFGDITTVDQSREKVLSNKTDEPSKKESTPDKEVVDTGGKDSENISVVSKVSRDGEIKEGKTGSEEEVDNNLAGNKKEDSEPHTTEKEGSKGSEDEIDITSKNSTSETTENEENSEETNTGEIIKSKDDVTGESTDDFGEKNIIEGEVNKKDVNKAEVNETEETVDEATRKELKNIINSEIIKPGNESSDNNLPEYYNILYKVKPGDTLASIARKYGLFVSNIKLVNGIDEVKTGQTITLPIPKSHLYIIKKGETLWQIYLKFGVSVSVLQEINNIKDVRKIPAGTLIIIPKRIND